MSARLGWSVEAVRILLTLPPPVRADILWKSWLLRVVQGDVVAITTIGHGRRRKA